MEISTLQKQECALWKKSQTIEELIHTVLRSIEVNQKHFITSSRFFRENLFSVTWFPS